MKASSTPHNLPLFSSAKRRAIEKLYVRRKQGSEWITLSDPNDPNGRPFIFGADELVDREAVRLRFGGGRYEVIGRDETSIVARTTFVLDGPTVELEPPARAPGGPVAPEVSPSSASPLRPFATPAGERQALVFALLDDGLDLVQITRRTGIDARAVREITLEWLTPLGAELPETPAAVCERLRTKQQAQARALRASWEASWSASTK